MPMDFPDSPSLERAAKVHGFRAVKHAETGKEYRDALANHVKPIDRVESFEIKFGVGWNKWTSEQKLESLFA